ncbi:MAG: translation initiation factor IF-2 [Myxococcales bacterium]|nr:translation initiation factor IF-2 [Myxococcales bacterium]
MSSDSKIRLYELAREVDVPNKELVKMALDLGFSVKSHMSSLTFDEAGRLKKNLGYTGAAAVPKGAASKAVKQKTKASTAKAPGRRRPKDAEKTESAKPIAVQPMVRRRKAAPVAEVAPNPVVTTRPAPEAVAAPEAVPTPVVHAQEPEGQAISLPVPTPLPPPVLTPPPAVAAPVPTPQPVVATPVVVARRQQVVVAGPDSVDLPGHQRVVRAPEPAPVPVAPRVVADAVQDLISGGMAPEDEDAGEEPTTAKERFEAELQRARDLASARHQERADVKAKKVAAQAESASAPADGRPAVGTVIELPSTRIKVVERPLAGSRSTQVRRDRFNQQNQRGRGRNMHRKTKPKGAGRQTQITTPAEHKRVVRIEETTTVGELGKNMGIKAQELLKKLWGMGMVGISLNASIDFETAQLLAAEFHHEVQNVAFKENDVFASLPDEDDTKSNRPPVVTVMGHVDHGKTSLLDYIRNEKVTAGESGGITQHIGAYKVDAGDGFGEIVFIDTPGHAAFTEMRARGAECTDIVVLICAADDGAKPQTIEALKLAKAAEVTIIVAVNKSDTPGANPDRVRQQLADHGLIPEEWGGDTIYVDCSAITGDGVDKLLEAISLNAELLDLKANPDKPAIGTVIEARLDRSRGPISTVLIQEGTLRLGDTIVVGECLGKVRAAMDHAGRALEFAGPGTPVEILGINGVPSAGDTLNATEDEKMAKQVVESRQQQKRKKELASSGKVSLEKLMSNMKSGEDEAEVLKIVLKADVQGSVEALKKALVEQSTEKVSVDVIAAGVGGITESDVNLAHGNAIIVGFHVRTAGKAGKLAEKEGVQIKLYDIIYDCLDDVKAAMEGLLSPIQRQVEQGRMEVRETFTIPRRGVVAGCMVTSGRVARRSHLRVIRDSVQVYEGKVSSLRRFKDEASEVKEGYECGLMLDGYNELQIGDLIESYEVVEEKARL